MKCVLLDSLSLINRLNMLFFFIELQVRISRNISRIGTSIRGNYFRCLIFGLVFVYRSRHMQIRLRSNVEWLRI